jgi:hypothetical protein
MAAIEHSVISDRKKIEKSLINRVRLSQQTGTEKTARQMRATAVYENFILLQNIFEFSLFLDMIRVSRKNHELRNHD